jgi:hypothetical protein
LYRDVATKRSTMSSFAERLHCVLRLGPPVRSDACRAAKIGSLAIVVAAIFWRPELAVAQASAPPRDYTNLGPDFIIAPGTDVSTEYGDLLLWSTAAARFRLEPPFIHEPGGIAYCADLQAFPEN